MSQQASIPLEGDFNCWTRDFDLPDLIFAVCQTGETGLLRFVNVEAEKTLFVRDGRVTFATSSSSDDRLGEYLLRLGKVRLKVLTEIGQQVKPGKRLGALLVERSVLEPKELVEAVVGHIRAMIVSLFRWTDGWYGFTAQEFPTKETITLEIPTADLILAGVRQIDSWRRILRGVGELGTVYRAVPGREATVRTMDVEARGVEILAALREPLTVEAVCARSELHDFEVCRLLWVYRSVGLIDSVEAASAQVLPAASENDPASLAVVHAEVAEAQLVAEAEPVVAEVVLGQVDSAAPVEREPAMDVAVVEAVAADDERGEDHPPPIVEGEPAPQAHPFEVWRSSCGEGEAAPGEGTAAPGAEGSGAAPVVSGDADLEGLGLVLQNDPLKTLRRPAADPSPGKISTDV